MDCDHAIELLPWFLNGTLAPEERREVAAHAASCERCAAALAGTRAAWEVFAQHVPAADLVAYAADEPTAVDGRTVERHLAGCPQCAAELEMARASRALIENEGVAVMPARGRQGGVRMWRSSALAAGLVGLVAIGGWVNSAQRAHDLVAQQRGGAATVPLHGGGQAARSGALFNVPQLTLSADDDSAPPYRGGSAAPQIPTVPQTSELLLVLDPSAKDNPESNAVDLVDPHGGVHPLGAGLVKTKDGYYTLSLPRDLLQPGRNRIRIYSTDGGRRTLVDGFTFQVGSGRP